MGTGRVDWRAIPLKSKLYGALALCLFFVYITVYRHLYFRSAIDEPATARPVEEKKPILVFHSDDQFDVSCLPQNELFCVKVEPIMEWKHVVYPKKTPKTPWVAAEMTGNPDIPDRFKTEISDRFKKTLSWALGEHAAKDGYVIMTSASSSYLDLLLNMLFGLKHFGIDGNVVIVCEDQLTYDTLYRVGYESQIVLSDYGFKREKGGDAHFGNVEYWSLTKKRPWLMQIAWETGVHVIWADSDMYFAQNIFEIFRKKPNLDVGLVYEHHEFGAPIYCSGLVLIKNNDKGEELIREWQKELAPRDDGFDQLALNAALRNLNYIKTMQYHIINKEEGCSGKTAWDEKVCDGEKVIFVHANFVVGHYAKLRRLKCSNAWVLPCHLLVDTNPHLDCEPINIVCEEDDVIDLPRVTRVTKSVKEFLGDQCPAKMLCPK